VRKVFDRLHEIEKRMSANAEGTEITRANALSGLSPAKLSPDTFALLSRAIEFAGLSGGGFDPSIGALVKLWGIGTDAARLPSPGEIAKALALVGYRDLVLDPGARTVFLPRAGMKLDLGGIAKGYAADEGARILREAGIDRAILDFGGNILVLGGKTKDAGWKVGILDPFLGKEDRKLSIASIECRDEAVVTSGVYERYFVDEASGKRYHHIFDPATGYPVENGLVSVSIVTGDSTMADALSTSLFVLGRERGMALGEELGMGVIMIDSEKRVYLSKGLRERFVLIDPDYELAD
jgi:thiamine biosynthesis lipoprotein